MRPRQSRFLSALCLILVSGVASAQWTAYHSENFTVYSDLREDRVLQTIREFELFRQVALGLLGLPEGSENEELRIFMFGNRMDYSLLEPQREIAGFFYHSTGGPRMIIGPESLLGSAQQTLYHEYVHYLMDRHSDVNYPLWYAEGLAQLLQTTRFSADSVVVGTPPPSFDLEVRYYKNFYPRRVGKMIDLDLRDSQSSFYLTAWLMVHYLLFDSVDDATRIEQTANFLLRYDSGEDPIEAFAQSFGIDTKDLDKQLREYSRAREFNTFVLPQTASAGEVASESVPLGAVQYQLGKIALELGRVGAAFALLEGFQSDEVDALLVERAESARAVAYIHAARVDDGDALIEQILAREPADSDVLADIAHYTYDRYQWARDQGDAAAGDHLQRAIDFGERASTGASANPEALYYLGLAYELDGELPRATQALVDFIRVHPSIPAANLALARLLVKQDEFDLAAQLIVRVYSASHAEETREKLREAELRIEDVDFVVGAIDALL